MSIILYICIAHYHAQIPFTRIWSGWQSRCLLGFALQMKNSRSERICNLTEAIELAGNYPEREPSTILSVWEKVSDHPRCWGNKTVETRRTWFGLFELWLSHWPATQLPEAHLAPEPHVLNLPPLYKGANDKSNMKIKWNNVYEGLYILAVVVAFLPTLEHASSF